jgi:transcription initiation factor TFIID subunit 12
VTGSPIYLFRHPLTSTHPPTPQRKPTAPPSDSVRVLQKESLKQLLSKIVPDERVDPLVEDFLLDVADDFVDSVVSFACKLANHRKSDTLEIKDIVCHLERAWDMVLPGFENDELKEFKPRKEQAAHKKRMVDVRRAMANAAAAEKNAQELLEKNEGTEEGDKEEEEDT